MDRVDLLKQLDLDAPGNIEGNGEVDSNPVSPSPTALEVDEWGLRRGRELCDRTEPLRRPGLGAFAAADFLAAAFEPDPRLKSGDCTDPKRKEFLKELLVRQVTGTVRWEESIRHMVDMGVTRFIEVGPGKVLSGLIKRIAPSVALANVETPAEAAALGGDAGAQGKRNAHGG